MRQDQGDDCQSVYQFCRDICQESNLQDTQYTRVDGRLTELTSDDLDTVLHIDSSDVEPERITRESSNVFQQTCS